ncbi:hypothetical protein, partial [Faecalibacterium sp.]|uniref:hypothetical protein n=1 Tax=Faecalibacterium sp. TaxID=1971605 RepID=UPI0025C4470B
MKTSSVRFFFIINALRFVVYRFRWQKDTTNRRAKGQRAGDKSRTQLFLIVFKQQRIDLIDVIDFVFQAIPHDPVPAELDKSELVGARPLHLACARPFCCSKAPLGLSLLRKRKLFSPQ